MKLWKKGLSTVAAVTLLATAAAGTAMGAEDREKITSVRLKVESSIEAGEEDGDVTVTAEGSNYEVVEVEIVNDDGEWSHGDEPKVEITLEADSDYYFTSMSSSKVDLRGDDAKYVSSKREDDNETLIITIRLDKLEGTLEIDDVNWENDNTPIARWESADGAKNYQVRLYRGSSSVGEAVTTSSTSYNFASRITREGDYTFRVRAVNSDSDKGEWYESDSMYVDEDLLDDIKRGSFGSGGTSSTPTVNTNQAAGWVQDSRGWWYRNSDGSYPSNGWLSINGAWYCFDGAGYMRTGWIQSENTWYYCELNGGYMFANTWAYINGAWYCFDGSGRMRTGWIESANLWYYCEGSGRMLVNTRTPDGFWVDGNGVWIQGR